LNSKRSHIAELDGVRGLAILMVLAHHCFWFGVDGNGWGPVALFFAHMAQWGRVGVNLFFILSGLLITGNLLDQRGEPDFYRSFYRRRALRILPPYFLLLAIIWAIYPNSGAFVFLCLIFLGDCAENFGITPCYPVLWSLAIEEQFYLVWPWIVGRTKTKSLVVICLAVTLGMPILRGMAFRYGWSVQFWIWFDHFTWGALLACLVRSKISRRILSRLGLGLMAFALVGWFVGNRYGLLDRTTLWGASLQYSWLACLMTGFLSAVFGSEGSAWGLPLRMYWLTSWGKISYSAYLIHCLLLTPWDRAQPYLAPYLPSSTLAQAILRLGIGVGATYVVARVSHRYLETPLMALGRSKSTPIATNSQSAAA
jgi:peptidoglycan/LPS O-acetylase OafA/YrhL